jgi:hypothetical protein
MSNFGAESMNAFDDDMTSASAGERSARGARTATRSGAPGWLAVPAALTSGAVMLTAGYLLRTCGSGFGSLATIPGGLLIVAAFALAHRPTPQRESPPRRRHSRVHSALRLLRNFGLPADLALGSRVAASSLIMTAGAVMLFGGYAAGASWVRATGLALVGGLLISAAFAVVARASGRAPNTSRRGNLHTTRDVACRDVP